MLFTHLENFLPFSSNLKLSSTNAFILEESKFFFFFGKSELQHFRHLGIEALHLKMELCSIDKMCGGKGRNRKMVERLKK